jgi:hypothetical protein
MALVPQTGSMDQIDLDPTVVDSIATDASASPSGPVWVWLEDAEETGDRAVVKGCADVGYFQPAGASTPAEFRAEAWFTELERIDDSDGPAWKVSRFNAGAADEADPFEKQCAGWATHDR